MRTVTAPARPLLAVAALGLAVALTGCSGAGVRFTPATSTAAEGAAGADAPGAAGGTDAAASTDEIRLPEFPVYRVPDVSALTAAATRTRSAIAAAVPLPPGVEVTGARCDAKGAVVNRAGASGEGQTITDAGVSDIDADGGGQLVGDEVIYDVAADGSGQITAPDAVLAVEADGSGQYTGEIVYQVEADGSGSVVGEDSYDVAADGSGRWVGAAGVVENNGDGSGSWIGEYGEVVVNGDGTGTMNDAPITIAPMPKFALLGTLPKLAKLKPVGRPCGTLIRISAGLLFDFDSDAVRPEAQEVLAGVATALGGTTKRVQVDGHTDSKGSDAYNEDLSLRRAQAVVDALTAAGLDAPMTARGFGETRPVAANSTGGKDDPAGRQLNRRVEIVVPS
ncbi:OmpA family protein [Kineosporia sp. A_224]|uniref:OmpA family protein n=1 Tax=Kineosporia sp. A_224 TaxID=1962180 RepID=UPI000B4A761B|nr:OmpA family protein [Kineosporia sp. A_224]